MLLTILKNWRKSVESRVHRSRRPGGGKRLRAQRIPAVAALVETLEDRTLLSATLLDPTCGAGGLRPGWR